MSDSNSLEVDPEKTVKDNSNKNKRKRQMKRQKEKQQRTDINERVLTDPFRRLSTMKDMSISMVGLDGAGKTTILYKLGGENVSKAFMRGYYMETLVYDNITLKAWDVSGQLKTRLQGSRYFKDTKGLIFVVDSNDRDRLDRARYELHRLLNEELLKDVVLLVFANKQDEPNRMNEAEITERLRLSTLRQCHRYLQNTCATTGAGLYEGLDWLSKNIKHTFDTSLEGVSEGLNWLRVNKPNMVICKVFESENSKSALAVRSIAADTREVQETLNRRSAHRAKIKLLEAATREERTKEDSCQVELGVKVQRLIKKVQKYERDEHKEADAIDPPNRERTS